MNNSLIKEKIRSHFRDIRYSELPLVEKKIKTNVFNMLLGLSKNNSRNNFFGIYWPLRGEVDLRFLKSNMDISFALPATLKSGELIYRKWETDEILLPDSSNIPSSLNEELLTYLQIKIMLVPALAIDQGGYRLGYGGGYYDRLRQNINWRSIKSFVAISF